MSEITSPFVIENREQLIALLAEAAEIEHNLMCCYLYAAFSLKEERDEDLSEVELDAVQRWRRQTLHVAIDEMAHLALVANLTAAVGGVPHFGRANFPVPAGYHPAGIVVKLAPFNAATLDHFIYLERPEGSDIPDGKGFEPARRYRRFAIPGRLMPSSHDYDTVGELYRAIRSGFERLSERMGEAALFLGNPAHQLGADVANLPGLTRVRCLKTARQALDGIVTQGEGAPGHTEESHYQRFLSIKSELQALQRARPDFTPARPAAHNPVMRPPPTPEDKVWIGERPAADLLDLANAAYTHMLRLLLQAYAETRGQSAQRALVDAAVDSMFAITPIASWLTRLPANREHPACTAGMSFATVRGYSALTAGPASDSILVERLDEIAELARRLEADLPGRSEIPQRLAATRERLAEALEAAQKTAALPEPPVAMSHNASTPPPASKPPPAPQPPAAALSSPAPSAAPAVPASVVVNGVETVQGRAVTLEFEAKRCIHARHCVLGQPAVFKANVQGPWLDPDAASLEALAIVAHQCPSGAIRIQRKDGGENEGAPLVNLIQVRENGPLGVRAEIHIDGVAAGYRATLCRCGASANKPYCDGSHNNVGFVASGEPKTIESQPLAARNGVLDVRPQRNGPLVIRGNVELCAGTGRTVERVTSMRLCRCGGSANKPYCDGTHSRIGFQS